MIHIEFQDAGPEEIVLNSLAGWVVRVNDDVDIFVTGTTTDERGWRRLVGLRCDDEGNPIDGEELTFSSDDLKIDIY